MNEGAKCSPTNSYSVQAVSPQRMLYSHHGLKVAKNEKVVSLGPNRPSRQ
ncbi:hypothetical protein HOV93_49720 [Planctomycetes bacterium FF15]|uniref:Uncharacterized protein n=1 Tax=Bremerella alba TaxID=980252 RepID=A0A7V8VA52_9BACT|nr:hypothetical protein [Bremerella alba]